MERSKGVGPTTPPVEPAGSLTHWGEGLPPPEVERFLRGPQPRGFELARAARIF
jgi:hypothetical protein